MNDSKQREAKSLHHHKGEEGFMLLAVVVMCAIVLLTLSVAAAVVAKQLRRDKEVESQHRANDYVMAIRRYYKKSGTYPPSMDALEKSNNVRFLREKWVDPLTGKSDWRIIHQGEQKTTIKGFFGKELLGIPGSGGGLGSAAGMQSGAATTTVSGGSVLGAGFGGATVANPASGSTSSTGATGTSGATGSTGSSTGMFGDSAGGGIIVGVGTSATGNSITEPNQQNTYETWEFWYDPRIELMKAKVNILGGGMSSSSASSFGQDATSNTGSTGPSGPTGATAPPFGNSNNGLGSTGSTGTPGSGFSH